MKKDYVLEFGLRKTILVNEMCLLLLGNKLVTDFGRRNQKKLL